MSDSSGYTAVVAVKCKLIHSDPNHPRFYVCSVPPGAIVESGDVVFFGIPDENHSLKGVCVSDTLYLPQGTLEMACRVTNTQIETMPVLHGKANIEWYTVRKENAVEQNLL